MGQKVLSLEELSKKYPTEKVFSVNKEKYATFEDGIHLVDGNDHLNDLVKEYSEKGYFEFRKHSEYNPEHLQLIPYVVIKHKDKYFAAKRIGGDVRSIGKIAIGMGGHINPPDEDKGRDEIFKECIKRELSSEELNIDLDKTTNIEFRGIIRYTQPEDLLSQDHLGLLYLLETTDENVSIKETDKLEGRFFTLKELLEGKDKAESWSRLILDLLEEKNSI